jgi:short-subunit dehydrogenase
MKIEYSHIMITGANRGIGRALALMAAKEKAHLHVAVRTRDLSLREDLLKAGALSYHEYEADFSSRAGVDQFLERHGNVPIDILVNNSGLLTGGPLEDQRIDEILEMIQVNINALIQLTHAYLPGMLARRRGKIVNNSSVSAFMRFPGASTYAASKAAVAAFTECLQTELKDTGVSTLLLVTPGVDTRMFHEIPTKYGKNMDVGFLKSIPAESYAAQVRQAIQDDLKILTPKGRTGLGLAFARHAPATFGALASRAFKRN